MTPEKRKAIAHLGGKAAHAKGTAHCWNSVEAREAGRKGGIAVSQDRQRMTELGRLGGTARGRKYAKNETSGN